MGGLAAMFGGLGQAAQNFGDKQRLLNLQQWAATQKQMLDGYDEYFKELGPMSSPELMAQAHQARAALAKVRPGDHKATAKAVEDFQNLLAVHPNTIAAVAPPGPPKPQPGPAAPGETPGMGTLSNMISNPGAAAAPASSPVQPSRQSAPGPSGLPEQSLAAPPAPASAAAAPETSSIPPVGAAPVGASPAPASPSMTTPIPPNPLVDRFMQPGLMPPSLATAVQPSMANRAELERQQMLINQRLGVLSSSGVMNNPNIPEYMKAVLPLEAAGVNVPMYGVTSLQRSHQLNVDASGMDSEEKSLYGIPEDGTGHWTVDKDGLGRPTGRAVQGWSGVGTAVNPTGTEFQYNKNNPTDPLASHSIQGPGGLSAVTPSMAAPKTAPTAAGGVEQYTPAGVNAGVAPKAIPGAVAPSMLPTTTNELRSISTVDANGNSITRLEPVSATRTRGGVTGTPAAPSAPAATHFQGVPLATSPREFEKPFTPEQQLKAQQQLKQYNIAIDRMSQIKAQLPLLNSLINSQKLNLEMDTNGLLKAVVNRNMPMTDAEAKFIGNFRTMMEDINLLRGPMGATGFRGPEAWAALQAQRGQLLADPRITTQVMDNSIAALRGQQVPLAKKLRQPESGTKVHLTEGGTSWDIPAEKVEDFKRDHPNAR